MKETLKVKNFGPLKDINLELKDFMVLIGPQGSGKSTISKLLVSIYRNHNFQYIYLKENTDGTLNKMLADNTTIIYKGRFKSIEKVGFENAIVQLHSSHLELIKKIIETSFTFHHSYYRIASTNQILQSFRDVIHDILLIIREEFPNRLSFYQKKLGEISNIIVSIKPSDKVGTLNKNEVSKVFTINSHFEGIIQHFKYDLQDFVCRYIPSERIFIPSASGTMMNLVEYKVPLPPGFTAFGSYFEKARKTFTEYRNDLLDVTYKYENGLDKLYINNQTSVDLKEAASGYQTLIPLMLVLEYLIKEESTALNYFIIEEPELNLYPSTQKALVEWLVKKCKESNSKLLMTTHSPYILTAMNNLVKAGEVAKEKPEEKKKISKVIKEESWLEFDKVGAYYINKGKAKSIMNKKNRTIDANAIDDVSDVMGAEFDKLLDIQYGEG